jgi:hypothetical protein
VPVRDWVLGAHLDTRDIAADDLERASAQFARAIANDDQDPYRVGAAYTRVFRTAASKPPAGSPGQGELEDRVRCGRLVVGVDSAESLVVGGISAACMPGP